MPSPFRTSSVVTAPRHVRRMPPRLSPGQGTRGPRRPRVTFMVQYATPMGYRWVSWDAQDVERALDSIEAIYEYPREWVADILVTKAA